MSEYKLKLPPVDEKRLQRYCKDIADNCKDDRKMALEAYEFFKAAVDENPADNVAKALMAQCLKLIQSSSTNYTKLVEVLGRMTKATKGKTGDGLTLDSLYEELKKK